MRVIKPKSKQRLWPVTTNPTNQWTNQNSKLIHPTDTNSGRSHFVVSTDLIPVFILILASYAGEEDKKTLCDSLVENTIAVYNTVITQVKEKKWKRETDLKELSRGFCSRFFKTLLKLWLKCLRSHKECPWNTKREISSEFSSVLYRQNGQCFCTFVFCLSLCLFVTLFS